MIRGYFAATHPTARQPYTPIHPPVPLVDSFIWLPELGDVSTGVEVTFLTDTGADITTLHPQDSLRLLSRPEHWDLVRTKIPLGVGGAGHGKPHYPMDAVIAFVHDDATVDAWSFTLYIAEPTQDNIEYESLLGRDVLGHYIATFDQNATLAMQLPPGLNLSGAH